MAEFTRKKRYYNYNHPLCKKYLRIDFQRTCAYCGAKETEFISSYKSFEIDHFKPQNLSLKDPRKNKYENLYYSCEICNGVTGKSGKWSEYLLDPCKDDIYGQGNHIEYGDENNDHKLIPLTMQGDFFIQTINLNQKDQRIIRKKRFIYLTRIEEKKAEAERLKKNIEKINERLKDDLSFQLFELYEIISKQLERIEEEIHGPYSSNDLIEDELFDHKYEKEFENTIQDYLKLDKVYGEFDLDYQAILKTGQYVRCYARFIEKLTFFNGVKRIRISHEQANDWKNFILTASIGVCIFLFNLLDKKIYYFPIHDFLLNNKFEEDSIYISVPVREDNVLCDETCESFYNGLELIPIKPYESIG